MKKLLASLALFAFMAGIAPSFAATTTKMTHHTVKTTAGKKMTKKTAKTAKKAKMTKKNSKWGKKSSKMNKKAAPKK